MDYLQLSNNWGADVLPKCLFCMGVLLFVIAALSLYLYLPDYKDAKQRGHSKFVSSVWKYWALAVVSVMVIVGSAIWLPSATTQSVENVTAFEQAYGIQTDKVVNETRHNCHYEDFFTGYYFGSELKCVSIPQVIQKSINGVYHFKDTDKSGKVIDYTMTIDDDGKLFLRKSDTQSLVRPK